MNITLHSGEKKEGGRRERGFNGRLMPRTGNGRKHLPSEEREKKKKL